MHWEVWDVGAQRRFELGAARAWLRAMGSEYIQKVGRCDEIACGAGGGGEESIGEHAANRDALP